MFSLKTNLTKGAISGVVAGLGAAGALQATDASGLEQLASTLGAAAAAFLLRSIMNWLKNAKI